MDTPWVTLTAVGGKGTRDHKGLSLGYYTHTLYVCTYLPTLHYIQYVHARGQRQDTHVMYTQSERTFGGHRKTYRQIRMQPTALSTHLSPRTVPMCVQTSDLHTDCVLWGMQCKGACTVLRVCTRTVHDSTPPSPCQGVRTSHCSRLNGWNSTS